MSRFSCALLIVTLGALALHVPPALAICPSSVLGLENVNWNFPDSLSACPGGDSLVFSHPIQHRHPARLRVLIEYFDNDCIPRVGVPPESIWVTFSGATGTLKVNDEAAKTYADDSTNAFGSTRITVPSFSGSGTIGVRLYVSGKNQGLKTLRVRTADTNADGRISGADLFGLADITYDGTQNDAGVVPPHNDHWNRNALHGTLVRRTNYCETCPPEAAGTKGEGQVFWSPSSRFISFSAFVSSAPEDCDPACKIFIVSSDPREGNALTQVTFQPTCYHDYDPSWSPLNSGIVFDRADSVVIEASLPWLGSAETAITASNNPGCGALHGDGYPAVSPDGRWVAFSRCNTQPLNGGPGGWSLWKIPITGGTATQLTAASGATDFYASWSPDGQTIYFQRQELGDDQIAPWKMPAAGGTASQIFDPPSTPDLFDAIQPTSSPDGALLTMGYGKRDLLARNVVTHTLDLGLSTPTESRLVRNYPDTTFAENGDFPILSPHLSPDGTRLALGSKQVWAVRRNMNLPPAFTSVTSTNEGTRSIPDTAATMSFTFDGVETSTITVLAADPEGNALTYRASFLQPWMTWVSATRTLTGTPAPGTVGKTFYVKFWVTTPSGGTDAFIAVIKVEITLGMSSESIAFGSVPIAEGPNPTSGSFSLAAPAGRSRARLSIYDVAGRHVAVVEKPTSGVLRWEGTDRAGALVPPGIYLWRLEADQHRREGKVVVVR